MASLGSHGIALAAHALALAAHALAVACLGSHDLKKWNVEVFGHVQNRRRQAMDELNVLDVEEESRPIIISVMQYLL